MDLPVMAPVQPMLVKSVSGVPDSAKHGGLSWVAAVISDGGPSQGDLGLQDHQGRRGGLRRRSRDPAVLVAQMLNKYREANGGTEAELTLSERARLKELERVVADLRAEPAF